MPFAGIVDPEELAMLRAFHAGLCKDVGIEPLSLEGQDAATLVLVMFNAGARTSTALKIELARRNALIP